MHSSENETTSNKKGRKVLRPSFPDYNLFIIDSALRPLSH
jgi:hypothetical protein